MELLAHVSAPTSNKHDDRYRVQANNYLAFEPFQPISNINDDDATPASGHGERSRSKCSLTSTYRDGYDSRDFATFIDDTQLAISGLESQILTSSLRKALGLGSPPAKDPATRLEKRCPSRGRESETPSKRPRNPAAANHVQNSTRIERNAIEGEQMDQSESDLSLFVPLQQHAASPNPWRPVDDSTGLPRTSPQRSPQLKRRSESASWSDEHLPIGLPSTYSVSDETSKGSGSVPFHASSRSAFRSAQRQAVLDLTRAETSSEQPMALVKEARGGLGNSDLTCPGSSDEPDYSGPVGVNANRPRPSEPPHNRASADLKNPTDEILDVNIKSGVPQGCHLQDAARHLASSQIPSSAIHIVSEQVTSASSSTNPLALIVRPGPPPTSVDPAPSSFITSALFKLSTIEGVRGRYRPLTTARDIRPRERGCWSFNPTTFLPRAAAQRDMWDFLTRIIEDGQAGWGVWMSRDPDISEVMTSATALHENGAEESTLGAIRVFCWGELVEHIWLLLYVASKSKFKRAGAVWCDAQGEVVVRT